MKYAALIGFVLLVLGGGTLIGFATLPGPWYEALAKPSFNPPNWVFGPVWSILYVLIAVAGWLVWRADRSSAAMKLWWLQLALNFAWSPVFFGLRQTGAALIVILFLLATILAFIAAAWRVESRASLIFFPYALWVAFATLLNASIYSLN